MNLKMNPIKLEIESEINTTSDKICSVILDVNNWSEFKGYLFLPGIKKAEFEKKTSSIVGSKIKVENTDGSFHTEEIIEWEVNNKIVLKFYEFSSPVKYFSEKFLEEWSFAKHNGKTRVKRSMIMYPTGILGGMIIKPVSILMKKALKKNLEQLSSAFL